MTNQSAGDADRLCVASADRETLDWCARAPVSASERAALGTRRGEESLARPVRDCADERGDLVEGAAGPVVLPPLGNPVVAVSRPWPVSGRVIDEIFRSRRCHEGRRLRRPALTSLALMLHNAPGRRRRGGDISDGCRRRDRAGDERSWRAAVPGAGVDLLRRFTAPGASINTGVYEPHVVPIRNGRPVQGSFRLDVHGFEIVRHPSAVADFTDAAEVDAVYVPEALHSVKEHTGADAVVSRGAVLRRSADPGEHGSQPQAALIHIDYSPEGAEMVAARVYAEQFPRRPSLPSRTGQQRVARVQPAASGLAASAVRLPQRP